MSPPTACPLQPLFFLALNDDLIQFNSTPSPETIASSSWILSSNYSLLDAVLVLLAFSISFSAPPTSAFYPFHFPRVGCSHTQPLLALPLSNTHQPPRTVRPFSTRFSVWLVYRRSLSSVWQFRCIYCGPVTFVHRQLPCYHNAHATPFEFCFRRRWQRPRP